MSEILHALDSSEASMFVCTNELKKRNVSIDGRRTSITLEPQVWVILHDVAEEMKTDIHGLCSFINGRKNKKSTLASSVRVFLISYLNIKNIKHKNFQETI